MEYNDITQLPIVCNNTDNIGDLIDSLRGKYLFVNTKTKESKFQNTITFKIANVIHNTGNGLEITGTNLTSLSGLPIAKVIELATYGHVSIVEHRHDDTYTSNYYLIA